MSIHTENDFHLNPSPPFDVRIVFCGYTRVANWNYTNVNLRVWLLYWNRTSGAELELNGSVKKMEPGEVILIPPYTTFSTRLREPFLHFYIHFEAKAPFDRVKREFLCFPASHAAKVLPRILKARDEISRALAFRLLIYEYLLRIPGSAFLPPGESVLDTRILRALDIMNHELALTRDNRGICKRIGMSLNNFYRLFLAETGTTPKHYLLNQRMESARRLLIDSEKTIDEIAFETGYADRYHFSKAFKSFYACPPFAYRGMYRRKS